ncbi:hypothetical protein F5X96DRAFT_666844 [Biscogniauxia mediterranea]|nr:hypothetical protein F5X96DRAFT_666844 [Biscogniauxia mediterranea]
MQFSPLTTVLALFPLVASALAMPGDKLAARQFYNGPCSVSNCGADGRVCSPGYVATVTLMDAKGEWSRVVESKDRALWEWRWVLISNV